MDATGFAISTVLGELYFNHRIMEDELEEEKKRSEDYKKAYDEMVIQRNLAISCLSKNSKRVFDAKINLAEREGGNETRQ